MLLIACSVVLTGARSFAAIGQWAKAAPQDALARNVTSVPSSRGLRSSLGTRNTTVFNVRVAPSTANRST
ncbi:hypothetical protein ACIGBH_41880 [Streptomyces sp. NPDC085929]|uniref:hypothetical protein n=1 Tax=Streptomyces sp. NPDC085929 TaxID=3365739 RepID=UPI0037D52496